MWKAAKETWSSVSFPRSSTRRAIYCKCLSPLPADNSKKAPAKSSIIRITHKMMLFTLLPDASIYHPTQVHHCPKAPFTASAPAAAPAPKIAAPPDRFGMLCRNSPRFDRANSHVSQSYPAVYWKGGRKEMGRMLA